MNEWQILVHRLPAAIYDQLRQVALVWLGWLRVQLHRRRWCAAINEQGPFVLGKPVYRWLRATLPYYVDESTLFSLSRYDRMREHDGELLLPYSVAPELITVVNRGGMSLHRDMGPLKRPERWLAWSPSADDAREIDNLVFATAGREHRWLPAAVAYELGVRIHHILFLPANAKPPLEEVARILWALAL